MFPKLETKRLVLREILPSDAEDIYSIFSNEEVTKYYGLNTFKKIEQAEKLIEAFTINFQSRKGMRRELKRRAFRV